MGVSPSYGSQIPYSLTMHFFDVQRVAHVLASRAAGKRCLCVAIEGAGGYGKSTLARELTAAAYATVVHGDDLYHVMDY
jgi:alpha-D-ribose 1-methylphosphonate 5-triphosphate synthase subunit PhnL